MKKKYRPSTFDSVVGQEIPKMVLRKVAHSPENMPQIYLLQGSFGCGKTSLARVFGRAVNCKSSAKPCLKCPSCLSYEAILHDPRYQEYDSAMVGNVANIKALRESWQYSIGTDYRTIVLDEVQTASKEAQSALLNIFEDPPAKTFIFLCTTDPQMLIRPLVSRSFVLEFNPLTTEEITRTVTSVAQKEGITLSEKSVRVIVRRSNGHARDAISLLETLKIVGEEAFLGAVVLADSIFLDLVRAAVEGDKDKVRDAINRASVIPLTVLNADMERFIKRMLDSVLIEGKNLLTYIDETAVLKIFNLYARVSSILGKSTSDFCSFLDAMASTLMKLKVSEKMPETNRFKKSS